MTCVISIITGMVLRVVLSTNTDIDLPWLWYVVMKRQHPVKSWAVVNHFTDTCNNSNCRLTKEIRLGKKESLQYIFK